MGIKSIYSAYVSTRLVDHPAFQYSLMCVFGIVSFGSFIEKTVISRCCEV